MRTSRMNLALAVGALATLGSARAVEDEKLIIFGDSEDEIRERVEARREYLAADFGAGPTRSITAADDERLRQAAERRARKVARQAKGFAALARDTGQ